MRVFVCLSLSIPSLFLHTGLGDLDEKRFNVSITRLIQVRASVCGGGCVTVTLVSVTDSR